MNFLGEVTQLCNGNDLVVQRKRILSSERTAGVTYFIRKCFHNDTNVDMASNLFI